MRKTLLLLATSLVFALVGCADDNETDSDTGPGENGTTTSADPLEGAVFNASDLTDYLTETGYQVEATGSGYYDVDTPDGAQCEIHTLEMGSADESLYVGDPNYVMDSTGTVGFQWGSRDGNDRDCLDALTAALEGFVPWAQDNGLV